MKKFQIIPCGEVPWVTKRAGLDMRWYAEGSSEHPELFEVRCDSTYESPQHAHSSDEIIFVLEGSLRLGARVCIAGTAIAVPAMQLYRIAAGEDGCRFLNFRSQKATTLLKDELSLTRPTR